ncbi:HD domain-containing phosphohydrolase [Bacillus suaedae]|uniref:HD domain-containing protein n=1 Tax=Halalkalibacter suaedae TaxID=2822140 RepID=A0A941AQE1_9BACI|nr:HD domain-containing phosphohydrolase [Bacillus suaedae]MBP3951073.1 HD domain-containing protein [Bacillus suaedae]
MAIIKLLGNLKKGDILSEDIYNKSTLLLRAGTEIDRETVKLLARWKIPAVRILKEGESIEAQPLYSQQKKKREAILFSKEFLDIKHLFYESLKYVVNESRYGYVLHNEEKLLWLEQLFGTIVSNQLILTSLYKLKKHDPYSYYHSFDVFLLGALLADVLGMEHAEEFATGCLIHDIGKLQISKDLLVKSEKLTKTEFEIMQQHTHFGVDWVREHNLPDYFEQMAKSHHERLDGSGYPEGLCDENLSNKVRMLMIVDNYSALTLKRPYRNPIAATKAIQLLLEKQHKFDLHYLIHFIELLNIYPVNSIVKLSNGKTARVKESNRRQPYRPLLEELDGSSTFELPTNLSVTIPRFLKWDHITAEHGTHLSQQEVEWALYLKHLLNGNNEETASLYDELSQGMSQESAFIDIIVKTINEISEQWDNGKLSAGEEHDALLRLLTLLQNKFMKAEVTEV